MLQRVTKPSHFSSLSLLTTINLLQSSTFSSSPNPKTLKPSISNKPNPSYPHRKPTNNSLQLSYHNPSNPTAQSILSLLSQPLNSPSDLNILLKDFKPQLNSDLVHQILQNYRILGRPRTLDFFSWAGAHLHFRFDTNVVEFMADFLGRRKLFDDLKCLLRTVLSTDRRGVSIKAVSTCIRFLGRNGRVLEALALFEMMELEFGCCPDNLVFNNVLYVLCKKDESGNAIDKALEIFRRIKDPDKFSYSNIIIGLCRFGRLESAVEVFREMGRGSLVPTRSAANVLVGGLCETARRGEIVEKVRVVSVRRPFDILVPNVRGKFSIEPAMLVFWGVLKLGTMPSAHVVNGLVSELCRMGKFEEAMEIVKVVENRKLRCVDESYSIMIKAFCDIHRVNEAGDLFDRMVNLGLKPKLAVYNLIIRLHCKLRSVNEAEKYFKIMGRTRCEPNCATFTMLIHAYCTIQNWEAAHGLLIEMMELGWHPHIDTYNLVADLLKNSGRTDLSLKLERKMEIQNACAHCKAGNWEAACDELNSMLDKGFHLPSYARNTIECAFRKSGKWKIARNLLEKMDQVSLNNNAQA